MSLNFYAAPRREIHGVAASGTGAKLQLTEPRELVEKGVTGTEFRGEPTSSILARLFAHGGGFFATFPGDVPAVLRLVEQLEGRAEETRGERALAWRCDCGVRYAVPLSLFLETTISCERCAKAVRLSRSKCLGEERLFPAAEIEVNRCRTRLASFLREAMARGWTVLLKAAATRAFARAAPEGAP
jgi:hypothetical protein